MTAARTRAYLFPGQGSQEVGMGRKIAEKYPSARAVYREAGEILGFDLAKLCFEGPEAELTLTKNSQPAIFVTSIACLRAIEEAMPELPTPSAAAGLSLGEFSAHVAAGSLTFADGLRLVRRRAESMQDACDREPSTMASIVGLPQEAVAQLCADLEGLGVLNIANLNSPGQIAISGSVPAVRAAMREAERRGAQRAVRLQVSGAFHSLLMKPAEERLRLAVAEAAIAPPRYPVIANVSALPVTNPAEIREALVQQLCAPVLWEKSMRALIALKTGLFVELGQGRVLSGLMRRIDKAQKTLNIQDPASLEKARAALGGAPGGAT